MKIKLGEKVVTDFALTLADLRHNKMKNELEFISIPYIGIGGKNKATIESLFYGIASNNNWLYPDCSATKSSIVIHMDSKAFKASFQIEVQPPRYSQQEKADILSKANTEMLDGNCSEYTIWQTVFAYAQAFHNGTDCENSQTIEIYNLELEPEEQNELQWFLIQRLQMEALGYTPTESQS